MKKRVWAIAIFSLLLIFTGILSSCVLQEQADTLDEKAQDIYTSLMCPLCSGQTLDQSQSEISVQMRALIREKLEQGWTKEEILQFFVERYGESVLAAPPKSGFNLVAWLAPVISLILAGTVLWVILRQWARKSRHITADAQSASEADNPADEAYRQRLEQELKNFSDKNFR